WSTEGKFRGDLYYRLGVFTIELPSLRKRGDDLDMLVEHFVQRFSRELGREVDSVDPQTKAVLRAYHWPGNIRELLSVIKQALLNATGRILLPSFLPQLAPVATETPSPASNGAFGLDSFLRQHLNATADDLYAEAHREFDRMLLVRVLEYTG